MAFWDDVANSINSFKTGLIDASNQATKDFTKAFGLAPQYDTSYPGSDLAPVSKQEIEQLGGSFNRLSQEERLQLQPLLDKASSGGKDSRFYFNTILSGLNTKNLESERKGLLESSANKLESFFSSDPSIKALMDAVTKGSTTDVLSEDDLKRMANIGNETLSAQSQTNKANIREDAASRGILDSGGALAAELENRFNFASEISKNTTNTFLGGKTINDQSKRGYAGIGSTLAALKGDLDKTAVAIRAGTPIPSIHLDELNAAVTSAEDMRKSLQFLNESSSSEGLKTLISTIAGAAQQGSSDALSLLGILKGGGGGGKSSSSSALGAAGISAFPGLITSFTGTGGIASLFG